MRFIRARWLFLVLGAHLASFSHPGIADSHQLPASFTWTLENGSAQPSVPLLASVRAQNADGTPSTNFNSSLELAALVQAPSPTIVLTEIRNRGLSAIELRNQSGQRIPLRGWRLFIYAAATWPEPQVTFAWPEDAFADPGEVFELRPAGTFPGAFPIFQAGQSWRWESQSPSDPVAVLLVNSEGVAADFFCSGSGFPQAISTPMRLGAESWHGLPMAPNEAIPNSYQRRSVLSRPGADAWTIATRSLGYLVIPLETPGTRPWFAQRIAVEPKTVQLVNGQWQGPITLLEAAPSVVLRLIDGSGTPGDSSPFSVESQPRLNLRLPDQASEASSSNALTGIVSLAQPQATQLWVQLSSDLPGEITLPERVLIEPGNTQVSFAFHSVDDAVLDGPRDIRVRASAEGYAPAFASITNQDDELGTLSLVLKDRLREGSADGDGAGEVHLNPAPSVEVVVTLESLLPERAATRPSVRIPAGQTAGRFSLFIPANLRAEDDENVTIRASALGLQATATFLMEDNQVRRIALKGPRVASEGQGLLLPPYTVTLSAPRLRDTTVLLTSSHPAKLSIPESVTVPAGSVSATFQGLVHDDALTNGSQTVEIQAQAAGYPPGLFTTWVADDDLVRFTLENLPQSAAAHRDFTITIYARTTDGEQATAFEGNVSLTGHDARGPVPVQPAVLGPFKNGEWTGPIQVLGEHPGTVLEVVDSENHHGESAALEVVDVVDVSALCSDVVYDGRRNQILAAVISRDNQASPEILGIDPNLRSILWSLTLAEPPGRVCLASDGQSLYVGLNTSGDVVQVWLDVPSLGPRFNLGREPTFGQRFVETMQEVPGRPGALVVSMRVNFNAYNAGTALFVAGTEQPLTIAARGFANGYSVNFFGDPALYLQSAFDGISRVGIVTNGLLGLDHVIGSGSLGHLVWRDEKIFTGSGIVLSLPDLRILGTLPASGSPAVAPELGRACFFADRELKVCDTVNYGFVGRLTLPHAVATYGATHAGGRNLAYLDAGNRLMLLKTDLLAVEPETDLACGLAAAPSATVGQPTAYTLVVTNLGPAVAQRVITSWETPTPWEWVSTLTPGAACTVSNNILRCDLGPLDPNESARVDFSIIPKRPGPFLSRARVIGANLNPENDAAPGAQLARYDTELPAVSTFEVAAGSMTFDPVANRLWMFVPMHQGKVVNELHSLRLDDGLFDAPISVGRPADRIAVSEDGTWLYLVVSDDSGDRLNQSMRSVRRFNLGTRTLDQAFDPSGTVGRNETITDIASVPGRPRSLAICRSGSNGGILILEDGVLTRWTSADYECRLVRFGDTEKQLFSLGRQFGELLVLDASVHPIRQLAAYPNHFAVGVPMIEVHGTRVYGNLGEVIDGASGLRLATLPTPGFVVPDRDGQRVHALSQTPEGTVLNVFDASTLKPIASTRVSEVAGAIQQVVACRPRVLALTTSERQVVVLNTAKIPPSVEADLQLRLNPETAEGTANGVFAPICRAINHGPGPAMDVTVTLRSNPGSQFDFLPGADRVETNNAGDRILHLGHFRPGGEWQFQFGCSRIDQGICEVSLATSSTTLDPVVSDNETRFTAQVATWPKADLSVSQFLIASDTGALTWWITASNSGPQEAQSVRLVALPPADSTVTSAESAAGEVEVAPSSAQVVIPHLPTQGRALMRVEFQRTNAAPFSCRAQVGSEIGSDPVAVNNEALLYADSTGRAIASDLTLPPGEIAYDASAQRFWVNVPPTVPNGDPTLVSVGWPSGQIGAPIHRGAKFSKLVASPDGRYLYGCLDGDSAVLRIPTQPGATSDRLELETFGGRPFLPHDVVILPGQEDAVAVSFRITDYPHACGIVIFDATRQRTNTVQYSSLTGYLYLQPTSDGTMLLASSDEGLRRFAIDAGGLSEIAPPIPGFAGPFVVANRRCVFATGQVYDLTTESQLEPLGPPNGRVAIDGISGEVSMLGALGNSWAPAWFLQGFDASTLDQRFSINLEGLLDTGAELLSLPGLGLLVRTVNERHLILERSNLPTPVARLSLNGSAAPDFSSVGVPLNFSTTVRNEGPWTATGLHVRQRFSLPIEILAATTSQGTCESGPDGFDCQFPALRAFETAEIQFTIRPTNVGILRALTTATSKELSADSAGSTREIAFQIRDLPSVSIRDAAAAEGFFPGSISFLVELSESASIPIDIPFATLDGTALAGIDYVATAGVLSIPAGQTQARIVFGGNVIGNQVPSADRYFQVELGEPSSGRLGKARAAGWIVEDDAPSLQASAPVVTEPDTQSGVARVDLVLSGPASESIEVDFATFDVSALAGTDFVARSGTIAFPAGETQRTLLIPVIGDLVPEASETFGIRLDAPPPILLTATSAVITLLDDDADAIPAITSFRFDGDVVRFEFTGKTGGTFQLEMSHDLAPATWHPVGEELSATPHGTATLPASTVDGLPTGFYRLRRLR